MATTFSDAAAVSDSVLWSAAAMSTTLTTSNGLGTSPTYTLPSDLIDNTPTGPRALSYLNGLLRLTFATPLTAGSGTPFITLFPLAALDGTNIASPPGAAAASPAVNAKFMLRQMVASTAYSIVDFGDNGEGFSLGPFKYAFQFYNSSGVAWSGGGVIGVTLYRWNPQGA